MTLATVTLDELFLYLSPRNTPVLHPFSAFPPIMNKQKSLTLAVEPLPG
jgi:hypothetical protein